MSTATEMLALYLAAETAILAGQEVRFGDRLLKMVNLPEIQTGRREWERRAAAETMVAGKVPSIGGLEVKVANFNPAPHTNSPFNRNC